MIIAPDFVKFSDQYSQVVLICWGRCAEREERIFYEKYPVDIEDYTWDHLTVNPHEAI
jgi:hypothetical protein